MSKTLRRISLSFCSIVSPPMSNLTQRLLTALIGIPIVVAAIYYGGYWLLGLVILLVIAAQYEFYAMLAPTLSKRHMLGGILLGAMIVQAQFTGIDLTPLMVVGFVAMIVFEVLDTSKEEGWTRLAWVMLGLIYPAALFSYVIKLRHGWDGALNDVEAFSLLMGLLVIVWATDSMAYFTGRAIGKTPLAPAISPKKTWEGTIGGVVGAVLVAILLKVLILPVLSWQDVFVCAILGGVIGQIGDLVESRLKRTFGVKDSGKILPGHGGVLDRIDGLILVIPLYYLYLSYFGSFVG